MAGELLFSRSLGLHQLRFQTQACSLLGQIKIANPEIDASEPTPKN